MIHVGRINYELGLCSANFDSRNRDIIPGPALKHMLDIPESRHWVLEEDPVWKERLHFDYCKARKFMFVRFRCHRINMENLR